MKLYHMALWLFMPGILPLSAQTDTVALEQVVVSAGRITETLPTVNRSVTVVSADRIASLPAISVNGILEGIPAVDVRERGPLGVQADVQIRGGTFDQTLVMLDGFPVNDPQTGHHNFNLPVSLAAIDRIEVLRGAASRVLGPGAFSGAVNVMLRRPEHSFFDGNFTGGQHGLFQANVTGGMKEGPVSLLGNVSRTVSNGYRPNTDFYDTRALVRLAADTGVFHISLLAAWLDKAFGANSFYTPAFPDQYEAYRTWFTGLKYETGKKIRFRQSVWWRRSFDRFELFRSNPPPWYTTHNYHSTDITGTGINLLIPWKGGQTSFGLDLKREKIRSNILGTFTGDSVPVPGEPAGFFTRSASRDILDLYLEHRLRWKRFTVTGGSMINHTSGYDWKAYGGIEAGYRLAKNIHLYTSVNQALRYPTFTDLYYNGPTNTGNPDLKPEESVTLEGGFRYLGAGIRASASLFNRRGKNLIDWGRISDTLKWQSMNLTDLHTTGIEMEINMDFRTITGNSRFYLEEVSLSWYYANAAKSSGNYISKYILDYLNRQLTAVVRHRLAGPVSVNWSFRIQDRAGSYTDYPSGMEIPYAPFFLTDVRFPVAMKHFEATLDIRNLFDTEYMDLGNIPMPGRWVSGTVTVRF
ncbi:MAG: TonB-dependent receptor [Chlorobi bacterium]|nr:TonB-dependent receptor [Chlorobiota bacterium]